MAVLDFPSSPTVGQKYPLTPVAGQPQYTWDGAKWTMAVVAADSLHVQKVGDTMTGALTVVTPPTLPAHAASKQYVDTIAAVPADAFAFSGMQVNGSCEVSQERGMAATNVPNSYICDGWKLFAVGAMNVDAAQQKQAYFPGLSHYIHGLTTVAQPSLGSGDYCNIAQPLEGWRVSRLAWGTAGASPITIGFWSMHHRTGLYSVSIRNRDNNRSYIATYTQTVADSQQYNVITIPGDVSGTWADNTDVGLTVTFTIAAGSGSITATPNTWLAGNFRAATGQVNGVGATSDIFRLSGLVVIPGTKAPTAAQSPLIMRPFPQELVLCQRYYEKSYNYEIWAGTAVGAGSNGIITSYTIGTHPFSVTKRAPPTIVLYAGNGAPNAFSVYTSVWGDVGGAAGAGNTGQTKGFSFVFAGGTYYGVDYTADARL